jgi:hypothetical protein
MKRVLNFFCAGLFVSIIVLIILHFVFSYKTELAVSIMALVYLPLGIIFNKASEVNLYIIFNRIAAFICAGIFVFFGPLAVAILSEQTLSVKERIYAGIILKFLLLLIITLPGVYDKIAKIGKKIKNSKLEF